MRHTGSCHCGAVTIEVEGPEELVAYRCDCSICVRTGFLHLIVAAADFKLVSGESMLTSYTFNTGVAKHYFCKVCGCKPFYVPRSNPDGFSVNINCMDQRTIKSLAVLPFDGKNWEKSAAAIAHLSKPD